MEKDFMPGQLPSVTLCLRNTLGSGCFQHRRASCTSGPAMACDRFTGPHQFLRGHYRDNTLTQEMVVLRE